MSVPRAGRLAAVDYGTVRIGVAICDPGQTLASPLENYTRRNRDLDAAWFKKLVAEERIVGLVVGLPLHNNGDESQKSHEARQFAAWLGEITGLPVQLYDERFTSALAEQYLAQGELTKKKRKARLDMLAAQILLASFLESDRGTGEGAL
jgi:putative Holliday junction resolvase